MKLRIMQIFKPKNTYNMSYPDLNKLTVTELQLLKKQINVILESKTIRNVNELGVGQWVNINHRKTLNKKFQITKINKKSVILIDGKGRTIKASPGLITAL